MNRGSQDPQAFGKLAESLAAQMLLDKGYKILERNFKAAMGEIDLVALQKRPKVVVVVEVKARRKSLTAASAALNEAKRKKLSRVAKFYMAKKGYRQIPLRFDLVVVTQAKGGKMDITHHQSAFQMQ